MKPRGRGELQAITALPAARQSGGLLGRSIARRKQGIKPERNRPRGWPKRAAGQHSPCGSAPDGSCALRQRRQAQSLPAQTSPADAKYPSGVVAVCERFGTRPSIKFTEDRFFISGIPETWGSRFRGEGPRMRSISTFSASRLAAGQTIIKKIYNDRYSNFLLDKTADNP